MPLAQSLSAKDASTINKIKHLGGNLSQFTINFNIVSACPLSCSGFLSLALTLTFALAVTLTSAEVFDVDCDDDGDANCI